MDSVKTHQTIGILGGTFDPVHYGHLAVACGVRQHFELGHVRLIPAGTPVHRPPPGASAQHRLAMLRLATAPYPELVVDSCEIDSPRDNYTVLTLQALRITWPQAPLLLAVGEDAFAQLSTWYQWETLFDLAHVVVINRMSSGGLDMETFSSSLSERLTNEKQALTSSPAGKIYRLTLPPHPASSTKIREALAAGHANTIVGLLPDPVLAYIARHSLYQAEAHAP